ncbi:DNA-binding response regulator, NarL/FixJ family, contains REC and HTH domains [Kosakonia radicincitans]|uniref:DNA-binding response regulator, NarL/FixJ family, contains REC and HTH domains n=2 Tax=Kosakonia radicincitans TaxID=283686 RepID=A0AAX2ESQ7_9ENTR|nr:DNA-binding response regulator, NarL/FixJ family, contains REC and HTH domains [Kosakonia radicincitans]SFR14051.1 DNA-binding response regulator, NarL/FixJ family, contains REC and HTH domains [Kosakonia radicincitans]SFU11399.1 DNA-binding response regulator, NarL/FixJ family, contains REC and HTH domains [Kosakonia radicincitans]SFY16688.1 DNA-binding response regulator, NarL/FixJ family, contains REC and HTH domains [Kosakonia radicincitans]
MENSYKKGNVAIIEKCTMSREGLRHLFSESSINQYSFHFFKEHSVFHQALKHTPFFSVIYSLFGHRKERRECLMCLHWLSLSHPGVQHIVLAGDDREAQLVGHLSPSRLHGILSKSSPLPVLQEQLGMLLGETRRINENMINNWYVSQCRMLSPTEWEILNYLARGFSLAEIASLLDRNVKTIRAHKFNAMTKLGVTSDVGLLDAADILTWSPPAPRSASELM